MSVFDNQLTANNYRTHSRVASIGGLSASGRHATSSPSLLRQFAAEPFRFGLTG